MPWWATPSSRSCASIPRHSPPGCRVPPRARTEPASDVEVGHTQRVVLDELAAWLDLVTHQGREDLARGNRVLDLHLEQDALLRIHRGLPQLLGVHLAQALVALDRHAALRLGEEPVERLLERAYGPHGL